MTGGWGNLTNGVLCHVEEFGFYLIGVGVPWFVKTIMVAARRRERNGREGD